MSHLRLILKARCGKHGYYPSISQHIIDIHQLIAIETYSDPYLPSYNHQRSQIEPFSAKMGPEWPFLRKFDDEITQKLAKLDQDVEISLQHNNFRPLKKLYTQKTSQNRERRPNFQINAFFWPTTPPLGHWCSEKKIFTAQLGGGIRWKYGQDENIWAPSQSLGTPRAH